MIFKLINLCIYVYIYIYSSAGAKDEVDALNIDEVDVPYQRIDIQYEISSWQQFKAITYKKLIFLINNYGLALLMVIETLNNY